MVGDSLVCRWHGMPLGPEGRRGWRTFDTHDDGAFAPVSHMTVGQFREWLLSHEVDGAALAALSPGLTPEMVAAAPS